ncbi:hypothetical protein BC940DRAFT_332256 [Gongronella butleri]|nr:hypothetical protein BC940DRAFT_332256 [Gongronella butleri]
MAQQKRISDFFTPAKRRRVGDSGTQEGDAPTVDAPDVDAPNIDSSNVVSPNVDTPLERMEVKYLEEAFPGISREEALHALQQKNNVDAAAIFLMETGAVASTNSSNVLNSSNNPPNPPHPSPEREDTTPEAPQLALSPATIASTLDDSDDDVIHDDSNAASVEDDTDGLSHVDALQDVSPLASRQEIIQALDGNKNVEDAALILMESGAAVDKTATSSTHEHDSSHPSPEREDSTPEAPQLALSPATIASTLDGFDDDVIHDDSNAASVEDDTDGLSHVDALQDVFPLASRQEIIQALDGNKNMEDAALILTESGSAVDKAATSSTHEHDSSHPSPEREDSTPEAPQLVPTPHSPPTPLLARPLQSANTTSTRVLAAASTSGAPTSQSRPIPATFTTEQLERFVATMVERATAGPSGSLNLEALPATIDHDTILQNFHVTSYDCDNSTVLQFKSKQLPLVATLTAAMVWVMSALTDSQLYVLGLYSGDGIHSNSSYSFTGFGFHIMDLPMLLDLLLAVGLTDIALRLTKVMDRDNTDFVYLGKVIWNSFDKKFQDFFLATGLPSSKVITCVPDRLEAWWAALQTGVTFEEAKIRLAIVLLGLLHADGSVQTKIIGTLDSASSAFSALSCGSGMYRVSIYNTADLMSLCKPAMDRLVASGIALHGKMDLLWRLLHHPRNAEGYWSRRTFGRQDLQQFANEVPSDQRLSTRAIARVVAHSDFYDHSYSSIRALLRLFKHQEDIESVWDLNLQELVEFMQNSESVIATAYCRVAEMRLVDPSCAMPVPARVNLSGFVRYLHCDGILMRNYLSKHGCQALDRQITPHDVAPVEMAVGQRADHIHPLPISASTLYASFFTITPVENDDGQVVESICDACGKRLKFDPKFDYDDHFGGKFHETRLAHSGEFTCDVCCGITFKSASSLRSHLKSKAHQANASVREFVARQLRIELEHGRYTI